MTTIGEVQTSLSLFAEAIAGAPVGFAVADDDAECWPNAAGHSRDTETNEGHRSVVLPQEHPTRRGYRALVLHQTLRVGAEAPASLDGRSPDVLLALFRLIEDHRISAVVRARYPGATADLDELLATVGRREMNSTDGQTDSADDAVAAAVLRLVRRQVFGGLAVELEGAGLEADLVAFVVNEVDRVTAPGTTPDHSLNSATRIWALVDGARHGRGLDVLIEDLPPVQEPVVPTDQPSGVSLDGGTPAEFTAGDGGGNMLGDMDGASISAETDDEDEDGRPAGGGLQIEGLSSPLAPEQRSFRYDEWDCHQGKHRQGWCRVIEEELAGTNPNFISDVRRRHQGLRSQIRRRLRDLRPEEYVRTHRSNDGDELDIDAAIEAIVDRRSRAPMDERLRIRRDRAARDVATVFLVDLSASTSSPATPPEPEPIPETDPMDDPLSYGPIWGAPPETEPVRRVIDVAKDAVALMGDALEGLGDRYAIYGFSGSGREHVEFKIGKDFDQVASGRTWAAVAAMRPLRYTRMGPAVRHATTKLAAQPAKTRLLIVVSDGYPQDEDYGRDRNDREYGLQDTAKALADAAARGIETFCLTIDPAGHDYLRAMCPDDRYAVIDDVESLPQELASLYLQRLGR